MANRNLKYTVEADTKAYVEGMSQAVYATDKTEKAIQDMIKESPPLKKALRDANKEAQNLAAAFAMLSDAEKKSAPGQQLAQDLQLAIHKAAELQDVMADTQTSIKNLASDTQGLDALTDSLSVMGDMLSTTLSTIGAVTGKQEDFNKAIAAYTAVQSAANAVTKIKNILQPQSNLMLKIGEVQTYALARAQELQTATTKKAAIAQRAFNLVAKANPYVLLATAVIAVGAALAAFVIKTKKAEKAQKEQAEATKKQEEAAQELQNAYTSAGSKLLSTYGKLQAEWKKLADEHSKNKWIQDNKDKFNELGIKINNTKDAESAFVGNTEAVVRALMKRAEAAAHAARAEQLITEVLLKQDQIRKIAKDNNTKNSNIGTKEIDEWRRNNNGGKVGKGKDARRLTDDEVTQKIKRENANQADKEIEKLKAEQSELNAEVRKEYEIQVDILGVTEKIEKTTNKTTKSQAAKVEVKKPSLEDAKAEIRGLEKKLEDAKFSYNLACVTNDQQAIEEAKKAVEAAQQTLDNKKAELKVVLDTDPAIKQLNDFNKKVEDIWKNLHMPKVDIASKFNFSALDETGKKAADALVDKYNKTADAIAKYNDMKANAKEGTDTSQIDEYISKLQDEQKMTEAMLEQKQAENDVNQAVMDQKQKQQEQQEQQNEAMEAYGQISKGVAGAIGEVAGAEAAQIAQMAMDMPLMIANAIKTIAVMNAEAQAKGAASAFALPFPANLAAWATIIGTITSIFASLPSFDTGGIVPGGTSLHDNRIAQVAAGEMILNQRQQDNLFKAIDQDRLGSGLGKVQIEGVIRGKDLLLVQKNYNAYAIKSGQNIYIK